MISRVTALAALTASLAFGVVSCTENAEITSPNDKVSFSASTTYRNLPETKTVYSGQEIDVDGNAVERIDWVANTDKVTIFNVTSDEAAVYAVGTPSASGTSSSADLSFDSGDEMTWSDGQNTFLSVYPSTAFSTTDKTFGGSIPAVQTQDESHTSTAGLTGSNTSETVTTPTMGDYAYMVAKTFTAKTQTVQMDFSLAVTAFEFNLGFADDGGTAPTISKFEMISTSTPLVGDWSWDGTDFTCPTELVTSGDNANNMITVNFDGTTPISATAPLRFTVFALPQDVTDITLKFYLSSGTKTLSLKPATSETFDTFLAGKKYRIITPNVSGGEWTYTLEEVVVGAGMHRTVYTAGSADKGIYTYKTHVGNDGGYSDGDQLPVEVNFRYSLADSDGNNLEDWHDGLPDWLSSLDHELPAVETPTAECVLTGNFTEMPAVDKITLNEIENHINALKAKGTNGATSLSPQDLSLYDIVNLTTVRSSGKPKTANSYVVDRAGWYMFPLVYGNAIDYEMGDATTGWNTMSYTDGATGWDPAIVNNSWASEAFVLHTFRNYLDNDIDTPYIIDNVGGVVGNYNAVVVWEDKPYVNGTLYASGLGFSVNFDAGTYSDYFIKNVSIVAAPTTSAAFKDATGAAKTVPYIKFEVDADDIREGNAIIALRDSENRIVWSWQIWVSDSDLTTTALETRGVVSSLDVLDKPLGYTEDDVEQVFYYSDRDDSGNDVPRICYIEVTHAEAASTCAPLVFQVTHTADAKIVRTYHSVTMYQYGRKDPFYGTSVYKAGTIHNGETRWMSSNMNRMSKSANSELYDVALVGGSYLPTIDMAPPAGFGMVSYGIQNPWKTINADDSKKPAGWTNSINRNLWNMVETNTDAVPEQGTQGTRTFYPDKDKKVVKTVYDPCPPGFSIPNYGAFTLFTTDGSSGSEFVGQIPEESDFHKFHVYYADQAQTRKIKFYSTNWRQHGGMGQTPQYFYYHTCKSRGQLYSATWQDSGFYCPSGPISDMARTHPVAVLPVKEIK